MKANAMFKIDFTKGEFVVKPELLYSAMFEAVDFTKGEFVVKPEPQFATYIAKVNFTKGEFVVKPECKIYEDLNIKCKDATSTLYD